MKITDADKNDMLAWIKAMNVTHDKGKLNVRKGVAIAKKIMR